MIMTLTEVPSSCVPLEHAGPLLSAPWMMEVRLVAWALEEVVYWNDDMTVQI